MSRTAFHWVAGISVLVIVAALYFSGSFDRTLYSVGLNWQPCGENGFGAVFCGSQLTDYDNRVQKLQQQMQQSP